MRRGSDALETINAAANMIASGEIRASRPPNRRWRSCWRSLYWCFGTHKTKRVGHATPVPEATTTATAPEPQRLQPPSILVLFAAPPSSPVSFVPSEPPSTAQTPIHTPSLSVSAIKNSSYSPSGPASMFAVGPYAKESQLVSPPVFCSAFTTEPSTAPYTPPPELGSAAAAVPPSPEVPFARFLEPEPGIVKNGLGPRCPISQYEFHSSYQLQLGSPVSHLISPISNSGTSSPFFERELAPFFLGEILLLRGFRESGQEPNGSLDTRDSDLGSLGDENCNM